MLYKLCELAKRRAAKHRHILVSLQKVKTNIIQNQSLLLKAAAKRNCHADN